MMKKLIQTECPVLLTVFLACAVTLYSGCHSNSYKSPEGYDLTKPKKMELGKVLNEISGICFNEEDNSILAISDSKPKIFEISLKKQKLKDYTDRVVGPDGDLEDILKVDSGVYILSSRGIIKSVPPNAKDSFGVQTYELGLTGQNDFETIYYDPTSNGIVMMCKTCAHEKGHHIRTAYRFDLGSKRFDSTAFYTINKEDVENVLKDKDAKFDPSAAAINPLDKRLYILSSASNLLIVTDTRGKVIEAYNLNPDLFPQAEGIAFAPNGDMYISNEGKFGKPTLLLFPHKSGKKNK